MSRSPIWGRVQMVCVSGEVQPWFNLGISLMTINHDVAVELSREERRRVQNEQTDALVASGALDDVFARWMPVSR